MRRWIEFLACLFISPLWGQYRLTGEQVEPPKRLHFQSTTLLSPTFIRISSIAKWDSAEVDLHFLFNSQGIFWIDEKQQVAYDVTPLPQDTLPFWVEALRPTEYNGRRGLYTIFHFLAKKMEVAWDTSVAFDWGPWLRYLPAEGLGTPARYFGKGIPLYWRLYNDKGVVENEFRLKHIEPFAATAQEGRVTYPIKKLEFERRK
ncbi:MAG: hypothetical protein NZZ60_03480 [Bacteroidia bacterium]|nr:hypothetical protein [Bacteroidia bacterium]MCX7651244.1 hypothetical protein [Bacteroidia bacterium]MDW8416192.1 hypothetical protein [Bacteroidia bacterium]